MSNHQVLLFTSLLQLVLLFTPLSGKASDLAPIIQYLKDSGTGNTILFDNAEHQKCGGSGSFFSPWNPDGAGGNGAGSTCKKTAADSGTNWPGLIEVISHSSPEVGNYVYKLPTEEPPSIVLNNSVGIHTAKFSSNTIRLLGAQYPQGNQGGIVEYSAFYFIESGFNDTEWHLQMQWKESPIVESGLSLYSGDTRGNPKIGWGFENIADSNGNYTRQIRLRVREQNYSQCDLNIRATSAIDYGLSIVEIPDQSWVNVRMNVKFHETQGYIKIWVDKGLGETLVIDATDINTHSRLISEADYINSNNYGNEVSCIDDGEIFYWMKNENFSFGVINYHGTHSYLPENLIDSNESVENHVLLVDDVTIKDLN